MIKIETSTQREGLEYLYDLARSEQVKWSETDLNERIQCIERFSKLLIENKRDLANELTQEVGKPITQSIGEIEGASKKCEFFINHSQELLQRQKVNQDGLTEEIIDYDSLGVIGHISAWNYPYLIGVNIFVPALIAGNAVLYKASEHCPKVGGSIASLLWQAGVPKNVFQNLKTSPEIGKALLELP